MIYLTHPLTDIVDCSHSLCKMYCVQSKQCSPSIHTIKYFQGELKRAPSFVGLQEASLACFQSRPLLPELLLSGAPYVFTYESGPLHGMYCLTLPHECFGDPPICHIDTEQYRWLVLQCFSVNPNLFIVFLGDGLPFAQ